MNTALRASVAALVLLAAVLLGGCGDDVPTEGGDAETSDPAAVEAITDAVQTMFSWRPATDTSSADAYARAIPYLTDELAAQAGERTERGPGRQWQDWAAAGATVDAAAYVVVAEHTPDTPDRIDRTVMVVQTVRAPDQSVLDSIEMEAEVTATRTPQGWRVSAITIR